MTAHLYGCDRMQPVRAETPEEAALVFAERVARRYYGIKAYAKNLRRDADEPLTYWAYACRRTRWAGEAGRDILIELEKRA